MDILVNSTVFFRLLDVHHPKPAEVMHQLNAHTCLQGEVLAVTNDGRSPDRYLVVRVDGLPDPVLVPVVKSCMLVSPSARGLDHVGETKTPAES
jgi:hypothetical protein